MKLFFGGTWLWTVTVSFFLCALFQAEATETYTYSDLVKRMTDLEQLAVLPPEGEQTALASSYDRKSVYDAAKDRYLNWDADGDGGGYVRKEGDSIVMADISGPGCIWRTWSASPLEGHVKIYLDGSETPTIDLPFKQYFDGSVAPFTRPNLVYTSSKGLNNYTPIPFQKSCKIVADKGWGKFYHFNYTRFPAGTVVPTFSLSLAPTDLAALDEADHLLGQRGVDPAGPRPGEKTETVSVAAAPGATTTVVDIQGPEAITGLRVKLDPSANPIALRLLLRQLTVRIAWDGQPAPAVWSPLGDFFGTIGGASPHAGLPTGMLPDGSFYAYWYMPFAKEAHVEMGNDGTGPVTLHWEVVHAPLDRPLGTLAYFHAKWHRDSSVPMREDRFPDWSLLTTRGRGRFVGTQLNVFQMRGMWWGEGDEKFFIDGEKFPSTYGTGSEDYFGSAWGLSELYGRAYHGNTLRGYMPMAESSVYRYHVSDSVPFQQSFEGIIEKYLPAARVQYAAVVYWYLSPWGTDPYGELPMADRVDYWQNPPPFDANLIEGEEMPINWNAPDHPHVGMDRRMSGGAYLSFQPHTPGDGIKLKFKAAQDGRYHVTVHFRDSPEGGIFQLSIGDQKLGARVDTYAVAAAPSAPVDGGTVDLKAGDQTLTVSYIDKNPAVDRPEMDLDYFRLDPAP